MLGLWFKVRGLPSGSCTENRGVGSKCAEGYCIYWIYTEVDDIQSQEKPYWLSEVGRWGGGSWATCHCKYLSWDCFHCEGCYGECSDTRECLGRMTSLVTDPDALGLKSSPISLPLFQAGCFPSLSLSFQVLIKLSWMITMITVTRIFSNSSQFLPLSPTCMATILVSGGSMRTCS